MSLLSDTSEPLVTRSSVAPDSAAVQMPAESEATVEFKPVNGTEVPPPLRLELVSVCDTEPVKALDFHPRGAQQVLCGQRGSGLVRLISTVDGSVVKVYDVDSLRGTHDASRVDPSMLAVSSELPSAVESSVALGTEAADPNGPRSLSYKATSRKGGRRDEAAWSSTVRALKFLPFVDAFVCGTETGELVIVELASGELVTRVSRSRTGDVRAIETHPTERLVFTAGDDKRVYVWSYARWPVWECVGVLSGHEHYITGLALHPEAAPSRVVCASTSYDTSLRVWTLAAGSGGHDGDDDDDDHAADTHDGVRPHKWSQVAPAGRVRRGPKMPLCFDVNDRPASWSTAPELADARPDYSAIEARELSAADSLLRSRLSHVAWVEAAPHGCINKVAESTPVSARRRVHYVDTPKREYRLVVGGEYVRPADRETQRRGPGTSDFTNGAVDQYDTNRRRAVMPVHVGPAIHVLEPERQPYSVHDRPSAAAAKLSEPARPIASIDGPKGHATSVTAIKAIPGLALVTAADGSLTFVRVGSPDSHVSPTYGMSDFTSSVVGPLSVVCVAPAGSEADNSHAAHQAALVAVGGLRGVAILRVSVVVTEGPLTPPSRPAVPRALQVAVWVPGAVIRSYGRHGRHIARFVWQDSTSSVGAANKSNVGCFTVHYLVEEESPLPSTDMETPAGARSGRWQWRVATFAQFHVVDDVIDSAKTAEYMSRLEDAETAATSASASHAGSAAPLSGLISYAYRQDLAAATAQHGRGGGNSSSGRSRRGSVSAGMGASDGSDVVAAPIEGEPSMPVDAVEWLNLAELLAPTSDWACFGAGVHRRRYSAWHCADEALRRIGDPLADRASAARAYTVFGWVLCGPAKSPVKPSTAAKATAIAAASQGGSTQPPGADASIPHITVRVFCGRRVPLTAKLCFETAVGLDWDCGEAWLQLALRLAPHELCKPLVPRVEPASIQRGDEAADDDAAMLELERRKQRASLRITPASCAAEACRCLGPKATVAWQALARQPIGDTVDIGSGQFLGQAEVTAHYLALSPSDGSAWYRLGTTKWPSTFHAHGPTQLDGSALLDPFDGEAIADPAKCLAVASHLGFEPAGACAPVLDAHRKGYRSWLSSMLGW